MHLLESCKSMDLIQKSRLYILVQTFYPLDLVLKLYRAYILYALLYFFIKGLETLAQRSIKLEPHDTVIADSVRKD